MLEFPGHSTGASLPRIGNTGITGWYAPYQDRLNSTAKSRRLSTFCAPREPWFVENGNQFSPNIILGKRRSITCLEYSARSSPAQM
jgi:hypothetical protein